jgi:xyloglucan-specific exo-beta-1,4-glucanase
MISRLIALLIFCLVACPASAEPDGVRYTWKNVAVGAGGFAPGIIFSPAEKGLAYLRTDMGGAYRWDDAQQSWIALQDGNPVSSYMGIESIAPDPIDPDVVTMAAGMGYWGEAAMFRSEDRGTNWRITPVPFKMGGNEDGRGLGERLAVDPKRTSTLFFGSRHDGLWRSDDSARTWHKVESFPHTGLGAPQPRKSHGGVSFVLFEGGAIYAGIADPGEHHLYRSVDGGRSWVAVPGGPSPEMLAAKASSDGRGNLYIAYSTSIGPNEVKGGSVWRLHLDRGRWTDVTPGRGGEGGYMGISADRTRPGRLAISSMNRWQPGDTVWISNDHGRSWTSLDERSTRDVASSPWLTFGEPHPEFGHWLAGLAFDPFYGGTLAYTTGATVYRTDDARRDRLTWRPWVRGVEQTAVITMISPTAGAALISGFGDLTGFVHDDLDRSPATMHLNPRLSNTNNLDFAGLAPNIVVRSGTHHAEQGQSHSLAWSEDGGRKWQPLSVPPISVNGEEPRRFDLRGEAPIHVSADGRTFVVATPVTMVTHDRGTHWHAAAGLPEGARVIGDKVDPNLFYALDYRASQLLVSTDGARTFARVGTQGLPPTFERTGRTGREAQWPLIARPGSRGELWLLSGQRLFRSRDSGKTFSVASPADLKLELFGLGMAAPGTDAPALFAIAERAGLRGVFRSTDGGMSWLRINDDRNQWGLRFRAVTGDPRRFGRVYVATDGRGIIYGDAAP